MLDLSDELRRKSSRAAKGTRVPVKILFDYLECGDSLDQFLAQYPSVHRDHAIRLLEESQAAILAA